MITALYIDHFKAFTDTQRVPIRSITLIYGPNSAGKSSFICILRDTAKWHEAHLMDLLAG
jgi:predicted ATPase